MKVFFLWNYYRRYLRSFHAAHPEAATLSFAGHGSSAEHGRAAIALAAATTRDGARAKVEAGLHDRDAGHAAAHDPQRQALEQ